LGRISLWKENHSNDYKYFDNRIREIFTAGGVGIYVHKLLSSGGQNAPGDPTQPVYLNQSEKNIQDLLFLENRDRHYEPEIYKLRGHYTLNDNAFNLSQFGMVLDNDTLYITFHINDMIERLGRKLIPGDVLEMPNMKDYWPLDDALPASLKKFYVVDEVTRAAEGYSPTWWPHLYRVKTVPMVDSQEFKEILDQAAADASDASLRDIMSPYLKNLEISNAIVAQAENIVPLSGYDTTKFFVLPVDANGVSLQNTIVADNLVYTTQNVQVAMSHLTVGEPLAADPLLGANIYSNVTTVNSNVYTPTQNVQTYLNANTSPNGLTVKSLTYFPDNPVLGQYILRTDYLPNTLYRWDGSRWQIVNDILRTTFTGNTSQTLLGTFVNNTANSTITNGQVIAQRQALSKILLPSSDF
jgi:hypothetical protein